MAISELEATTRSWAPEGSTVTPYARAKQEWDDRIGSARVQAANWRRATFLSLGLLGLAIGGAIFLGVQPKAIPHIITIDRLGMPTYLGPVGTSTLNYQPTEASINYSLHRFIDLVRTISSDSAVLKRNWIEAYNLVTPTAANQLNEFVRTHDPFARLAAGERVSIEITSAVPISQNSWQLDWRETSWNRAGLPMAVVPWRAIARVLIRVPSKPEELAKNPIGFFIDEFHWDRIQEAKTTRPSDSYSPPRKDP